MQDCTYKKLKIDPTGQQRCPYLEPVLADRYLAPIELGKYRNLEKR